MCQEGRFSQRQSHNYIYAFNIVDSITLFIIKVLYDLCTKERTYKLKQPYQVANMYHPGYNIAKNFEFKGVGIDHRFK